ncbi:zinc-binding dehydrogenase [Vulcanisaeta souniana]|uniref:zinc-binding dehydrogenase n=1 Tax=Vulcanisaeta souniana TaxID=164452 RepID=UPI000B2A7369|nr:zinc-binding dehydrogenase [Vulcanisaeta souniana]
MTAYGACRNAGLMPDEFVAVYGIGGVGTNIVQIASKVFNARVIAIDIKDEKLEFAQKLGAEFIINSSRVNPVDEIMKITNGRGADVAVEAIGLPATQIQAIKSVRAGGRAVMVGLSKAGAEAPYEINSLVRREVMIIGSYGGKTIARHTGNPRPNSQEHN